jgi:hypothetical protein
VIVGTTMAKREQCGRFANGAWAKARSGTKLCTHVKWRTKNCNICINRVPIGTDWPLAKTADANKWQIKPPAIITIHGPDAHWNP